MDSNYISSPTDFHHLEGSESVDLRKTFDLNGSLNDDMLRLYLRKAGLSDEIEYLTVEQHRAFIYDIIKSNKKPGYWLPSTMKSTPYGNRPDIRSPPSPQPSENYLRMSPFSPTTERRNEPNEIPLNYASIRANVSSGSLQNLGKSSPNLSQRFVPIPATPCPPSPTTFVTNRKGKQLEISGPINFQHTAGDMTRDMTRNAFDLSSSSNDNVLKKYMMERGITDDDVVGMRKNDLIRKIVQSKFTWLPSKSKKKIVNGSPTNSIEAKLQYATVSRSNDFRDNSPTPSYEELSSYTYSPQPSPPPSISKSQIDFSNYSLVTNRFADPSLFPSPNDLSGNQYKTSSNIATVPLPPLPPEAETPAPPPRKSHFPNSSIPPPPSAISSQFYLSENVNERKFYLDYDNTGETIPVKNIPPMNTVLPSYATVKKQPKRSMPPPPPPPVINNKNNSNSQQPSTSLKPNYTYAYSRTEIPSEGNLSSSSSINSFSSIQSSEFMFTVGNALPPPPSNKSKKNSIPPPPPPMMKSGNISSQQRTSNKNSMSPPAPPPPPIPIFSPSPSPSPVSINSNKKNDSSSNGGSDGDGRDALLESIRKGVTLNRRKDTISNTDSDGDGRDGLLDSIRKGVTLKKIDQKASTISGIKPRAERKPVVTDLVSELKLGITLRRVKNSHDNPFAENESNA